jgi:hypothetical protein
MAKQAANGGHRGANAHTHLQKDTGFSDSSQNKIQVLVTALAKIEELRHLLVYTKNQEIENGQNMEIGEKTSC